MLVQNKIFILFILLIILFYINLYVNKKNRENFENQNIKFKLDTEKKIELNDACKFSGFKFNKNTELGECSVAIQLIPYVNNVIEIGGGSGKVSSMINKILKERNLENEHIVVEPGLRGNGNIGDTDIIKKNRKTYNNKYHLIEKLADELTFEDIKKLKNTPDCLYVDCEGCLLSFFETEVGKYILNSIRYLVNEMDGNNEKLVKLWKEKGFKKIGTGYGCNKTCDTDVWYKD